MKMERKIQRYTPIFSDENAEPSKNSSVGAPFPIFSDEQAVPEQPEIVKLRPRLPFKPEAEVQNQENWPPRGNVQPASAQGVKQDGGVLTQAEGVAWMPLEDQERLLDEDERMQEQEMGASNLKSNSKTSALPNEDDFAMMAKLSSTPHTGRAFQVKIKHSQHNLSYWTFSGHMIYANISIDVI